MGIAQRQISPEYKPISSTKGFGLSREILEEAGLSTTGHSLSKQQKLHKISPSPGGSPRSSPLRREAIPVEKVLQAKKRAMMFQGFFELRVSHVNARSCVVQLKKLEEEGEAEFD